MARYVKVEGQGPIKIEPQDKPVFICGCGLTKNFPFCDGTHKVCKQEADGKVYEYDAEGKVVREEDANG